MQLNINPKYVDMQGQNKRNSDLFDVLVQARSKEELRIVEPMAQEVHAKYMRELEDAEPL